MSMKANIIRDAQGNIIVHMEGDLNYEHGIPLRQELQGILRENPNTLLTIDLGAVDFVGSSGICHFVETLKLLRTNSNDVTLRNVKSEFCKVFRLYGLDEAAYIANLVDFDNDETEGLNTRFGNRSHTYQN